MPELQYRCPDFMVSNFFPATPVLLNHDTGAKMTAMKTIRGIYVQFVIFYKVCTYSVLKLVYY